MILSDTSPEAQLVYQRRLAEMSPSERVRLGVGLWETAGRLQRAAILWGHPGLDDAEVGYRIAVTRFGVALARQAWRKD